MKLNKEKIIHICIILIPVFVFVYLFQIDFAPSGDRSASWSVGGRSPFIESPLPRDRINIFDTFFEIIDEPIYFSLHLPQTNFETVSVGVAFAPNDQDWLEIGALSDIFSSSYDFQPLYNKLIEELNWDVVESGDYRLFQRENTYDSLDSFFVDLPSANNISTYHADLIIPFVSSEKMRRWDVPIKLRGYHQMKVYKNSDDLGLGFDINDLNLAEGNDDITIRIWNTENQLVFEEIVSEDAQRFENNISLDSGVYRIELVATSDIIFDSIELNAVKMVFVNHLSVFDEDDEVLILTNAKTLVVETLDNNSAKVLNINDENIKLGVPFEKKEIEFESRELSSVGIDGGFVKFDGRAKFAFNKDAFFDPDPIMLAPKMTLENIDYIFTTYTSPEKQGDSFYVENEFVLSRLAKEKGDARFVLSAPGANEIQNSAQINSISAVFKKDKVNISDFFWHLARIAYEGIK